MTLPYSFGPILPYNGEFVVEVSLNGNFWDHHIFPTRELAEEFLLDPLKEDRQREERKNERERKRQEGHDLYFAHNAVPVSRGRKIGRKPAAA